jgi:hypothetical protein
MSDAAGINPSGAQPGAAASRTSVVTFIRGFPYALFFSSIVSAALVVVVGLLIAFMQYQARLLRVQPMLPAAKVLDYVATSNRLQQRFAELDNLANELTKSGPQYNNTLNEIKFRTNRICALFGSESNDVKRCKAYLYSVPFAGTTKPSGTDKLPKVATSSEDFWSWLRWPFSDGNNATTPETSISPELSQRIKDRFVEIMGGSDRKVAGTALPEMVSLYTRDMEEIAKKNVKFWLTLNGPYSAKFEQYRTICQNVIDLAENLTAYRKIDTSTCQKLLAQPRQYPTQPIDLAAQDDLAATSVLPVHMAAAERAPTLAGATDTTADSAGSTPAPAAESGAQGASSSSQTQQSPADYVGPLVLPNESKNADQQITFELVSNYTFYDHLLGDKLQGLLMSPSDFLALALVCFSGVLGALLRIVFFTYVSGRDPNVHNIFIGPILGLICALVVYILFRAGFIVVTDRGPSAETATLSPFVIAIMSMSAGLLSERAIDMFQRTSRTWLGSVEASQASRWAVRLKAELEARNMAVNSLAERLDVSLDKLNDWVAEKDMVPIDKQRDIALVLDVPLRQLFTDLPPGARA